MARRKRGTRRPEPEDIIKLIVGALLLISLVIGGATGFIPVFLTLLKVIAVVAAVVGLSWLIWRARPEQQGVRPPVMEFLMAARRSFLGTRWRVSETRQA